MSNVLCTFPGKYGDILWSLATVKHIAEVYQTKVDFGIMPQYLPLLGFLRQQEYIDNAFLVDGWVCTGSPHGDQPWESPVADGYEKKYDLGYRCHPSSFLGGPNVQLIDFIALQQGFKLVKPVPFMTAVEAFSAPEKYPFVSYAFNEYAFDLKMQFLTVLIDKIKHAKWDVKNCIFVNVGILPWQVSAATIKKSAIFIGCRSANWVIANGLGKPILTFEPHPERNLTGNMGQVFGCTYGNEHAIAYSQIFNIEQSAESGGRVVMNFIDKEMYHAHAKTVAR